MEVHQELQKILNGKICIIGRVDIGTTDFGVNPFHPKYVNVGTHGAIIGTIESGAFITPLPVFWSIVFAFIFVPLVILGISGFSPGLRTALGILGAILTIGIPFGLFAANGYFLGPLGPFLAMIAAVIIREAVAFAGSEHEKQFIRKAFSTYLSADVVQEIIADPKKLQLGGKEHHVTALFTDIRRFSSISEKLCPEELVSLLNRYLSAMSDVVLEQWGTIDKYVGDAIVAFFGAPVEYPDHAFRACISAIIMKRIEQELNVRFSESGIIPEPIYTRIGINTGRMVVGNMGTDKKMNYTIMGSSVNIASRLEGVNKEFGTWIIASEDTIQGAGKNILSRRLGRIKVVNIDAPVQVYEILETLDRSSPELIKKVELFHHALMIFENRDWTSAEAAFEAVLNNAPDDGPAEFFRKLCNQYRMDPPLKDWDGVIPFTTK
jgi:adenylate cyclase